MAKLVSYTVGFGRTGVPEWDGGATPLYLQPQLRPRHEDGSAHLRVLFFFVLH